MQVHRESLLGDKQEGNAQTRAFNGVSTGKARQSKVNNLRLLVRIIRQALVNKSGL